MPDVTKEEGDALGFAGGEDSPLTIAFNRDIWGEPGTHLTHVTFMGKKVLWHEWAVKPLMDVQADLIAEGWDKKYAWNDVQTYCARKIRNSSSWSMHSGPIAMDVNPPQNPYGTHTTNIPLRIREIFGAHHFVWGGDWNFGDPMHFEYTGSPIKDYKPSPSSKPFPYRERLLKLTKPYIRGDDILWVQQQCNKLKTYPKTTMKPITEDGIFGPATEAAVKVFQYRYKLSVDGIVGKNTWLALRKESNNL